MIGTRKYKNKHRIGTFKNFKMSFKNFIISEQAKGDK
jgi:hypothetical protein